MNESAAKATPRTSQSHGNGLNGACSRAIEVRSATENAEVSGLGDPTSRRLTASLALGAFSVSPGLVDAALNAAPGDADAPDGTRSFPRSSEL